MNLEIQNAQSISSLSDEALHASAVSAAREEKRATLCLLEFLSEIDARRLYSERGYSSLFEYVHRELGYSESQASERVSAMRLMRKFPEVKAKLEANALTLTSAARFASFIRKEEPAAEKLTEILEEISGKSTRETDRLLASHQALPTRRPDHFLPQGGDVIRVSFDADGEFMALFTELRNLQGNPEASTCERLKAAMKTEILRKQKFRSRPRPKVERVRKNLKTEAEGVQAFQDAQETHAAQEAQEARASQEIHDFQKTHQAHAVHEAHEAHEAQTSQQTHETNSPAMHSIIPTSAAEKSPLLRAQKGSDPIRFREHSQLRAPLEFPSRLGPRPPIKLRTPLGTRPRSSLRRPIIPVAVKKAVSARSGNRCEYLDPATMRRCESRFGLELDHYPVPFAMGGESTAENLRHACRAHNRLFAIQAYGREKMAAYFK